ncbi:MAG TPA: DUF2062 domain-containing protein [Phycisphaerae bacterium]|nr:DUF2062 domain-containing protein [Phycisphaerae bacterium]
MTTNGACVKICVVVPVFNHGGTVRGVVEAVRGLGMAVCVVDDGSADGSGEACAGMEGVTVVRQGRNRGKGAALGAGFRWAWAHGFTHAVTVDADGQHRAADVAKLAAAAREHPGELMLGWRDMEAAEARGMAIPARSKKGRDAARFWLRVQTGVDIPDTQCGLRAYPLGPVMRVRSWFGRYDFETEIVARLSWGGVRIRSVPVECVYFSGAERVSHFRPVMDTLRGVRVNVLLVLRRLMPWPIQRLVPREPGYRFGKWWKWATWREAVRRAMREGNSNAELATAFAMGVFVGLTPLYLLQTVLAIFFAKRLHLNVVAAVIGSQISIPPLMPLWVVLSYGVGRVIAAGAGAVGSFVVGNAVVAVTMAAAGLLLARGVLGVARPNGK